MKQFPTRETQRVRSICQCPTLVHPPLQLCKFWGTGILQCVTVVVELEKFTVPDPELVWVSGSVSRKAKKEKRFTEISCPEEPDVLCL